MALYWNDPGKGETEQSLSAAEVRLKIKFPQKLRQLLKEHAGGECEQLEMLLPALEIIPMTEYPEYDCLAEWSED